VAKPEEAARKQIGALRTLAGWFVCTAAETNICAHRSVAVHKLRPKQGHRFADYKLCVDGRPAASDSAESSKLAEAAPESHSRDSTVLDWMQKLPQLEKKELWPALSRGIAGHRIYGAMS
jgi:hypothetical protein